MSSLVSVKKSSVEVENNLVIRRGVAQLRNVSDRNLSKLQVLE